jgi:hypothetical protein
MFDQYPDWLKNRKNVVTLAVVAPVVVLGWVAIKTPENLTISLTCVGLIFCAFLVAIGVGVWMTQSAEEGAKNRKRR